MKITKLNETLTEDLTILTEADNLNPEYEDSLKDEVLVNYVDDSDLEKETGIKQLDVVFGENRVEKALDHSLAVAEEIVFKGWDWSEGENPLLFGMPGTGKTAIVYQWAKRNNIKVLKKSAATMDISEINGLTNLDDNEHKTATWAANTWDKLKYTPKKGEELTADRLLNPEEDRWVLFLDEFEKAKPNLQGTFLTLINDHQVPDADAEGGQAKLDNLLFVVIAINDISKLLQEIIDRTTETVVTANPKLTAVWYTQLFTNGVKNCIAQASKPGVSDRIKEIARQTMLKDIGRAAIAQTLLMDDNFTFDTKADQIKHQYNNGTNFTYHSLEPRQLLKLLVQCDGTKEDFLARWNSLVNYDKKEMAETILANYQDVQDKANEIWKMNFDVEEENNDVEDHSDEDVSDEDAWAGLDKGLEGTDNGKETLAKLINLSKAQS